MRPATALVYVLALVVSACGSGALSRPLEPEPVTAEAARAAAAARAEQPATPTPAPSAAMTATPVPTPALPTKLRVFVASEGPYSGGTGEVWVLEGSATSGFEVVKKIPQGGWPHNASISPDRKWIAVAQRSSNQVSFIDPLSMVEVARVPVGKQPHGISWSPDSKYVYLAHERDTYIGKLEIGTWKLRPIPVGVPQHLTATNPRKTSEVWFSITNSTQADHLRVLDMNTDTITNVKVQDVHDPFFTPDGSEVWSTSSGFLDRPSDRIVVYEPETRQIKEQIRFPGRYPFHSMRIFRDGQYFLSDPDLMVLTSHYSLEKGRNGASLLWVDWRKRAIVAETPLGIQPFHSTYDPIGKNILVTSNVDGMVNVVSVATRQVVQQIRVPKAHGIVAIGIY